MVKSSLIATGKVESLCVNGGPVEWLPFTLEGPKGDPHAGPSRKLSNHDREYLRISKLEKGHTVFNWRSWTALSREELDDIELSLGCTVPQGCMLENMVISGVQGFSELGPATMLVFPHREIEGQAILSVWGQNTPCHTIGQRLADHYRDPALKPRLIKEAQGRRGIMGFVLSEGWIEVGDKVLVYSPAQ